MAFVKALQCVLIVVGIVLIAAGLAVMFTIGVKPVHMQYYFIILRYEFKMIWPGNYTRTISECIGILSIEDQPTIEPVSNIIATKVSWTNCSDMDTIAVALCAYELQNYTGTPKLLLELYGCSFNESREIVNVDLLKLLLESGFIEHNGVY